MQANQSVSNTAKDLNKAKDDTVEAAAVKIDNVKQESGAQADLVKAGAETAIDQGMKAAENAIDDQLRSAEKVIDDKMKVASKTIDDKIVEANKYADVKRQELTNVRIEVSHRKFQDFPQQNFFSISDNHRRHRKGSTVRHGRSFKLVDQIEFGRKISFECPKKYFQKLQCLLL